MDKGEVYSLFSKSDRYKLDIPANLYKLKSFDDFFEETISGSIYIPSANEFNDPQDSKIPFRYNPIDLTPENIYKKRYDIIKKAHPTLSQEKIQQKIYISDQESDFKNPHFLEIFDEENYNKVCSDFGIFCLTPDRVNYLMWSYYANSHQGYSVGYSTEQLLSSGLFSMGGRMLYKEEFPLMPLFPNPEDSLFFENVLFKINHLET